MELSPAIMQFAVFIPIIIAFYFLLIRPQQKRQKAQETMLAGLQKNDRVITSGGLIGRIAKVDQDELRLTVGDNVDVTIMRNAVTHKLQEPAKTSTRSGTRAAKPRTRKTQQKSPARKKDVDSSTNNPAKSE